MLKGKCHTNSSHYKVGKFKRDSLVLNLLVHSYKRICLNDNTFP